LAQVSLHNNNIEATVTLHYLESIKPPDCDIYQGDPLRNRTRQLRKAKKDRRKAQRNSYDKQQKYLAEKIEKNNKDKKGIKVNEEIIRIKQGEKRKRLYRNFARLQNKTDNDTLSFIDVPDKEAFWAMHLILLTRLFENTTMGIIIIVLMFLEYSLN
jgi:hypothetical protein